jgi:hypothetical protein
MQMLARVSVWPRLQQLRFPNRYHLTSRANQTSFRAVFRSQKRFTFLAIDLPLSEQFVTGNSCCTFLTILQIYSNPRRSSTSIDHLSRFVLHPYIRCVSARTHSLRTVNFSCYQLFYRYFNRIFKGIFFDQNWIYFLIKYLPNTYLISDDGSFTTFASLLWIWIDRIGICQLIRRDRWCTTVTILSCSRIVD